MKRIPLLIIALAVAAFAGWYYWKVSLQLSGAPVSALLPRETIFLAHLPDFNRTRDDWRHCDIYQLYREPAVQDFLRPALAGLSKLPKTNAASQTLQEIEQLDPKHAFLALTSIENNNPRFVGGFRFGGSQEEAERLINRWRSTFLEQTPSAKLEKMRCIAGSMRFENGKIHDGLFLGMPKLEHGTTLTRSSVSLGTKETFFYLSMLLNLGEKIDTLNQVAALAGAKIFQVLADSGIAADDWKAAFGLELSSLADWPSSAHWPSLLLTLPIIDAAKAGKIVEALIRTDESATWTDTTKDGVRYFSKQSAASLIAITPTIAVSDRILIAGLNPVSVEEAMKRSGTSSSELSDSETYKAASRLLPAPTNFFAYVALGLLYSGLDVSLLQLSLLAAAFVPAIAGSVDPTKLPSPDVITKHLIPFVFSVGFDRVGYVAESIGPITLDQSAIGLAIFSSLGAGALQKAGATVTGWAASPTATPRPTASPSPTP